MSGLNGIKSKYQINKLLEKSIIEGKIDIYKQEIKYLLSLEGGKHNLIEILSRVDVGKKVSPEVFFSSNIDKQIKIDFDFYVLENVLKLYNDGKIDFKNIHININPVTFINDNFIDNVDDLYNKYNITDLTMFSFEILENGSFNSDEIKILNKNISILNKKGIRIGLDDYPNLNNNNELLNKINKLDFIKIDKGILFDYYEGRINKEELIDTLNRYISSIKEKHKDSHIILEGVEYKEIEDLLKENIKDIEYYQGYYHHRPEEIK